MIGKEQGVQTVGIWVALWEVLLQGVRVGGLGCMSQRGLKRGKWHQEEIHCINFTREVTDHPP